MAGGRISSLPVRCPVVLSVGFLVSYLDFRPVLLLQILYQSRLPTQRLLKILRLSVLFFLSIYSIFNLVGPLVELVDNDRLSPSPLCVLYERGFSPTTPESRLEAICRVGETSRWTCCGLVVPLR